MPFFKPQTIFAALMATGAAILPLRAEEAALYEAPAPEDAVFVRVLAEFDAADKAITFAGQHLPRGETPADTYVAISAANLSGVRAGSYYSLAAGSSAPVVIEEPARETAAKVHLILVNTATDPVRLIVPTRETEVIAAVTEGAAASRAVNPIAVTLAVQRVSDGALLGTFDLSLSRGQNMSFIASADSARLIENSFGPVLSSN
ncbi:alginate O-acetyltransferase AlgF [Shimia sp. R9_3]|uniref:alginate O-acetyltransferase AlgF n=1 Tax=Shimia sp. R9_3 TaxID=2821113 RepID=UPI001ADCA8EE|nr:alginate O-acetyltransferase AlgF [Shimia sp. R9_3]MBO9401197.1 alginate O-acetyltransferase AlgF [Shimia sp. R9_3]